MSETIEERTRRRRWLSLAELVAVASVLIGALSLYLSWSDKRETQAERAAEAAKEQRDRADFELRGVVASGNRSVMLLRDEKHALKDVTVTFPSALGAPPQDAIGHSIETEWFAKPLLKLTDGGPDNQTGRLPILVTYSYTAGDHDLKRSAIYDVVWDTSGRFLRGRTLAITDFRLRERGGSAKRLDALWQVPTR